MRTTLRLDDDAFQAAKVKASHEKISLGKAISELIRQALRQSSAEAKGSAVFRSRGGIYTGADVEATLNAV